METKVFEKSKGEKGQAYEDMKWLLKAKSCDETRGALQYVLVTKKRAIACDGYRMHFVNVKEYGMGPGLYKVLADTSKQVILQQIDEKEVSPYPNWQAILPRHMERKVGLYYESFEKNNDPLTVVASKVIRALDPEHTINLNFLRDCVVSDAWTFYPNKNPNGPVYFKNCTRSAVIMPLRMS